MRCVVQRVNHAKVSVEGKTVGQIRQGLCVFVGVGNDDAEIDVHYTASKLAGLRVFEDTNGKMNLNLKDIAGEVLVVSQFTLFGDVRKGNRPSFTHAADPGKANAMIEQLVSLLRGRHALSVATGQFRADMDVELVNDGPVTVLLDSRKSF